LFFFFFYANSPPLYAFPSVAAKRLVFSNAGLSCGTGLRRSGSVPRFTFFLKRDREMSFGEPKFSGLSGVEQGAFERGHGLGALAEAKFRAQREQKKKNGFFAVCKAERDFFDFVSWRAKTQSPVFFPPPPRAPDSRAGARSVRLWSKRGNTARPKWRNHSVANITLSNAVLSSTPFDRVPLVFRLGPAGFCAGTWLGPTKTCLSGKLHAFSENTVRILLMPSRSLGLMPLYPFRGARIPYLWHEWARGRGLEQGPHSRGDLRGKARSRWKVAARFGAEVERATSRAERRGGGAILRVALHQRRGKR